MTDLATPKTQKSRSARRQCGGHQQFQRQRSRTRSKCDEEPASDADEESAHDAEEPAPDADDDDSGSSDDQDELPADNNDESGADDTGASTAPTLQAPRIVMDYSVGQDSPDEPAPVADVKPNGGSANDTGAINEDDFSDDANDTGGEPAPDANDAKKKAADTGIACNDATDADDGPRKARRAKHSSARRGRRYRSTVHWPRRDYGGRVCPPAHRWLRGGRSMFEQHGGDRSTSMGPTYIAP